MMDQCTYPDQTGESVHGNHTHDRLRVQDRGSADVSMISSLSESVDERTDFVAGRVGLNHSRDWVKTLISDSDPKP